MQLQELILEMDFFANEREWNEFHTPKNLIMGIASEAGELLDCILWDNPTPKELQNDQQRLDHMSEEMADVFLYLIRLSSIMDIDLIRAAQHKLQKNRKKYPTNKSIGVWRGRWEN